MGPEQLVTRLKAIREPRMRVLALVDELGRGEPGTLVETLGALVARAHATDDADVTAAVLAITHAAAEPSLTYEVRKQLYEAGLERGMPEIARLFLAASPAIDLPATLVQQLGPERPLRPAGRSLTLGERKALARTHDREQLLLLLRDPHPAVVTILLDNPHVTEGDILKIASMRPAVPDALERVAAHPRWSVRHAVKRALVLNPSTPLAVAIRIATTLRANELAELAVDPSVPEPLRVHAAQVHAASRRST